MRSFFGGQIEESKRGDLAAVVKREPGKGCYGTFLYPINSLEFVHLTGVGDVNISIERAYLGLSQAAADEIARRTNGVRLSDLNLMSLDELVVSPFFLDSYPEKPASITLFSTADGYSVHREYTS
ncbi:MAG: hypothetical protein AABX51_03795 [Nanoarchaeota archaeon]